MATKKKVKRNKDGSVDANEYLEAKLGPLTFAMMLRSIRECDEITLEKFAKRLGISRAALCDIEHGRKGVSPERAARWARVLGYSEPQFVGLALQANLDAVGLKYKVTIERDAA